MTNLLTHVLTHALTYAGIKSNTEQNCINEMRKSGSKGTGTFAELLFA